MPVVALSQFIFGYLLLEPAIQHAGQLRPSASSHPHTHNTHSYTSIMYVCVICSTEVTTIAYSRRAPVPFYYAQFKMFKYEFYCKMLSTPSMTDVHANRAAGQLQLQDK